MATPTNNMMMPSLRPSNASMQPSNAAMQAALARLPGPPIGFTGSIAGAGVPAMGSAVFTQHRDLTITSRPLRWWAHPLPTSPGPGMTEQDRLAIISMDGLLQSANNWASPYDADALFARLALQHLLNKPQPPAAPAAVQDQSPGSWFRLPCVVRLKIYRLSLEVTPRVLIYEAPHRPLRRNMKMKKKYPFRRSIHNQPLITAICRESRCYAYGLGVRGAFNQPLLWFFPATDIFYINRDKHWEMFTKTVTRGWNHDGGGPFGPREWFEDRCLVQHLGVFAEYYGTWIMTTIWDNFTDMFQTLPCLDVLHFIRAGRPFEITQPQNNPAFHEPWWQWHRRAVLTPAQPDSTPGANNVSIPAMSVICNTWDDVERHANVYIQRYLGRNVPMIGWVISRRRIYPAWVHHQLKYHPEKAHVYLKGQDLDDWYEKNGRPGERAEPEEEEDEEEEEEEEEKPAESNEAQPADDDAEPEVDDDGDTPMGDTTMMTTTPRLFASRYFFGAVTV